MDESHMAKAFNEWMRRYIEDPKGFEAEFQSMQGFCEDRDEGKEPSYGTSCAAYLIKIDSES